MHWKTDIAKELAWLRKEVERCHSRLEIDYHYEIRRGRTVKVKTVIPALHLRTDGIEARDTSLKIQMDTIHRQARDIKSLNKHITTLVKVLEKVLENGNENIPQEAKAKAAKAISSTRPKGQASP